MKQILAFLNQLVRNNNREWFAQHKSEYLSAKQRFDEFTQQYIDRMSDAVPELRGLVPADCQWRIYRDTRFSPDKTPYKDHFGCFLAQRGGKKSPYGGYYVHISPTGCMFAAGIWCPEKELLQALRQSVLDNYEELEGIVYSPEFKQYFTDFDTDYQLSRTPMGYPRDFVHDEWLRLKTFTISCPLSEALVTSDDFLGEIVKISLAARPVNQFLNYTVEELYS